MGTSLSEGAVDAAPRTVTFHMTADEVYRVSRMVMPRWTSVMIGVGAVLILICGAALVASGQAGLATGVVLPALFLLASRPIARVLSMRRISRTLAKIPEPIELTIGPDGVRGARAKSSSLVAWTDIVSVDLRGPFVWIQGHARPVYAIPTRAFSGDADAQALVAAANGFLAASTRA